jgi:hypothetical protein
MNRWGAAPPTLAVQPVDAELLFAIGAVAAAAALEPELIGPGLVAFEHANKVRADDWARGKGGLVAAIGIGPDIRTPALIIAHPHLHARLSQAIGANYIAPHPRPRAIRSGFRQRIVVGEGRGRSRRLGRWWPFRSRG